CLLRAGDDHGTDAVVGLEVVQCGGDLVHHLVVERVERLRAVEGDEADTAAFLGDDHLEAHAVSFLWSCSWWGVIACRRAGRRTWAGSPRAPCRPAHPGGCRGRWWRDSSR